MGNQFIVAKHRTKPHDSFSQWLHLQEGHYYTFSGNFAILFLFKICKYYHCIIRLLPVILMFSKFQITLVNFSFSIFFSAWVQINEGKETVVAAFRNFDDQKMVVGSIIAQCGCWSMLKGGFSANQTTSFELYFEVHHTSFLFLLAFYFEVKIV